jgi:outer membrane biosynthesis protein TonB
MRRLWKQRRTETAIALSILLHMLFVWLFPPLYQSLAKLFPEVETPVIEESEPLVFELLQPKAKQVVENPLAADDDPPPETADLLSDKNSEAHDAASQDLPTSNVPYNEGLLAEAYEITEGAGVGDMFPMEDQKDEENEDNQQETQPDEQSPLNPSEQMAAAVPSSAPVFSRDMLTRPQTPSLQGLSNQSLLDNRVSRADNMGGLTLSTYAWDFAPYLQYLKRTIGRNIFPPPAFNRLGMIDGETLLQFTIHPDGTMTGLEVLEYDGHMSLMETSKSAITLSADFRPLPKDFPEPVLVITGKFVFTVFRNR